MFEFTNVDLTIAIMKIRAAAYMHSCTLAGLPTSAITNQRTSEYLTCFTCFGNATMAPVPTYLSFDNVSLILEWGASLESEIIIDSASPIVYGSDVESLSVELFPPTV